MFRRNCFFRQMMAMMLLLSCWCFAEENAMDIIAKRTLVNAEGQETTAETALAGKKFIGIYFSAHWCGPCRAFTPQLVKFHEMCRQQQAAFEVVFVSSDKSEEAMFEYMKGENMPWLALPYGDNEAISALRTLYQANGIPRLVIVDNKGNVVSNNARWDVTMLGEKAFQTWGTPDYKPLTYKDFQDKQKSEEVSGQNGGNAMDILGKRTLVNVKGKKTTAETALADKKYIGIYFSAHWCGPCRAFTPQLVKFYEKCHSKKAPLEIVFVSLDRSEEDMSEYMKGENMPWLAIPYDDREGSSALRSLYQANGIPRLVIVDNKGNVVSNEARWDVSVLGEKAIKAWGKPDYTPLTYQDYQNYQKQNTPSTSNASQPNGGNAMDIIGKRTLINARGKKTTAEAALADKKYIGIYFSAHWCGPCRAFTPHLVKFYEKCHRKKAPFELIFVSADKSEEDMFGYMKDEKMPWLALPFADTEGSSALKTLYQAYGIPRLVIVDNKGNIVSNDARWDVEILGDKAFKAWEKPDYTPLTYQDFQNQNGSKKEARRNNAKEQKERKKSQKKNKKSLTD